MALSDFAKQHYQRLAWYFAHGKSGGDAQADTIDIDLVGEGLVVRHHLSYGGDRFKITPAGEHLLHLRKEDERQRRRPHHVLGHRLATWLEQQDRLCWENVEIKVDTPRVRAVVRPDVLSMVKTYNSARMVPMVHEVKVSRADFLADVNKPEKRAAYFELADHVFYVLPEGMVKPEEVPPECGLIYETAPGVFKTVKKSRKNKSRPPLTAAQWMTLMLKTDNRQAVFDPETALARSRMPIVEPDVSDAVPAVALKAVPRRRNVQVHDHDEDPLGAPTVPSVPASTPSHPFSIED